MKKLDVMIKERVVAKEQEDLRSMTIRLQDELSKAMEELNALNINASKTQAEMGLAKKELQFRDKLIEQANIDYKKLTDKCEGLNGDINKVTNEKEEAQAKLS